MALFGNNGFFDSMWENIKDKPIQNILTGGLYGAGETALERPQDLILPGFQDTMRYAGKAVGEGVGFFTEGIRAGMSLTGNLNSDTDLQSELALKDGLRAQTDLTRARQARARSASLLTSTNQSPSLLG